MYINRCDSILLKIITTELFAVENIPNDGILFSCLVLLYNYIISPCEVISLHQYNLGIYHNELSSNLADYFSPLMISYSQK